MAPKQTKRATKAAPSKPAVYFQSLTIANFRSFGEAQTLDLSNENGTPAMWTIILGDNGVGKTTLLQCLAALRPVEKSVDGEPIYFAFSRYPELSGFAASLVKQIKRHPRFDINLVDYNDGKHIVNIILDFGDLDVYRTENGIVAGFHRSVSDENMKLVYLGYGATRRMGKSLLSEQGKVDNCAGLFIDDVDLLNAEEWLLQADYAANRASDMQARAVQRRDKIKELLVNLLPDVSDIRFNSQDYGSFTTRVEVETPYGWVTIDDLSLGYKTLMAWMVDLASRMFERYPDSDDPLREPAIVLVDEIDLHLHPRWQRTLVSYLSERFPRTQFIVTAHSPLVVQSAPHANIVLVRREGDHAVIDNDIETIANWRVDQVLTSDLFGLESARPPQLDKALEERRELLSQSTLTKADRRRLDEVEATIGQLPTGDTPDDIAAMDVIRRAAKILDQQDKP